MEEKTKDKETKPKEEKDTGRQEDRCAQFKTQNINKQKHGANKRNQAFTANKTTILR